LKSCWHQDGNCGRLFWNNPLAHTAEIGLLLFLLALQPVDYKIQNMWALQLLANSNTEAISNNVYKTVILLEASLTPELETT
jgi:hypothetical protein